MDKATLTGIIIGVFCVFIPIVSGGKAGAFFDVGSILIVLGGGFAATLIGYKLEEITKIMKVVAKTFSNKETSDEETLTLLVELSIKARREGLLALESEIEKLDDEFLKQFLQLVIDGVSPDVLNDALELELMNLQVRHEKGQSLFKTMGAFFPAWGMIGTLMGLIKLLQSLDDPSNIGPAMSLALVTTFYGSLLANFICLPIANKLGIISKDEVHRKEMMVMGLLSIQEGENPKIMEQKLKTFLSNEKKQAYDNGKESA